MREAPELSPFMTRHIPAARRHDEPVSGGLRDRLREPSRRATRVWVLITLAALPAGCGNPTPTAAPTHIVESPTTPIPRGSPAPSGSPNPSSSGPPSASPTTGQNSPSVAPTAVAFWDEGYGLVGVTQDEADGSHSGALLLTMDGGRTWTTVLTTPAGVRELVVADTVDVWALTGCGDSSAGSCGSLLYRSDDGGRTWTPAPTALAWVSFVDARHGWGVLYTGPGSDGATATLERTDDGGATWTAMPSPCRGSPVGPLRAVAFRSATSGLAVCALTLGAGGEFHAVLVTVDGGAHWAVRASTGVPGSAAPVGYLAYGGYIGGLVEASDGTAWMTGTRLAPLVSRDADATWRPWAPATPTRTPSPPLGRSTPGGGWQSSGTRSVRSQRSTRPQTAGSPGSSGRSGRSRGPGYPRPRPRPDRSTSASPRTRCSSVTGSPFRGSAVPSNQMPTDQGAPNQVPKDQ